MTQQDLLAPLVRSLPELVLVLALFAAATRRTETRVLLLVARRAALALLLVALAITWDRPLLAGVGAARLSIALLVSRAVIRPGERSHAVAPRAAGPSRLVVLLGAAAAAAIGYAASAGVATALATGGRAFQAGAAVLLIGAFSASARPRPASQVLGLLVLSDGTALAALAATGGDAALALATLGIDAGLALGAHTLAERTPGGTPERPSGPERLPPGGPEAADEPDEPGEPDESDGPEGRGASGGVVAAA